MRTNKLLILLVATMSLTAFASAQTGADLTSGADTTTTAVSSDTAVTKDTAAATNTTGTATDDLDGLDLDNLDSLDTGSDSTTSSAAITWGFSSGDMISVSATGTDSIVLEVPAIKDGAGNSIKRFKVSYSTTSVADTEPTSLQQASFEVDTITGSTVSLEVSGLNLTSAYYFVVEPINKDNISGQVSGEVSYTSEQHGAASGSNTLSDVTYSYSGMEVTLKWTPIEGATKAEIYFKTEESEDYTKVGDAKMSDGTFSFVLTKAGNSYVKIIPTDDNGAPFGPEIVKSLKVESTPVTPGVTNVPKVGPATDFMIALIAFSVIGYAIFRYRKLS